MKPLIFNQPHWLGDILFLIPLARQMNVPVVFPVHERYLNMKEHFPDINFVNREKINIDYDRRQVHTSMYGTVVPFRYSNVIMRVGYRWVMKAKYDMVEADYNTWRALRWERNSRREEALYNNLNPKGEPYDLIGEQYGNVGDRININTNTGRKKMYLSPVEGFTLLDWAKVIEEAEEIHTVHTSVHYLLEVLQTKSAPHIYRRQPKEPTHSLYDYLFNKRYIYRNN